MPDQIKGLLFDMDGVLTQTATVHAKAWKETFDRFLKARAEHDGTSFVPFDAHSDYDEYVDGKPREDGVRDFLKSRDITLPEGSPDDPPDAQTVYGVGNAKNDRFNELIEKDGVEPYPGSVKYVAAAKAAGVPRAVVSSSANTKDVLTAAGYDLGDFGAIIDGNVATDEHLQGKPHPDTYLAGAKALGLEAANATVFEDALSGVQAGRDGHFGYVVGVDRVGQADALKQHGADTVVTDLADLLDSDGSDDSDAAERGEHRDA